MRYIPSILILFVFVAGGCTSIGGFSPTAQGGHYQGSGNWRQAPAPGYDFADRHYELGVLVGVADGFSEAVDYFYDSEFRSGPLFGVSGTFTFPEWHPSMGWGFQTRYGIEVRVASYNLTLHELGLDYGDLNITTVSACFRFMQVPDPGNYVGFHVDMGLGSANTDFHKSSDLELEEAFTGIKHDIKVGWTLPLIFGLGLDFYLDPEVCVTLEWRYEIVMVPVEWKENGIVRPEIDWFNADNNQFILGIKLLFW